MRSQRWIPSLVVVILLLPTEARAAQVTQAAHGGPLDFTVSNISFAQHTLTGQNQTITGAPSSEWVLKDARGRGTGWNFTVSAAGALTSAAGSVESTARTIAISNLQLDPGSVSAKSGSDPTTNMTANPITLSTQQQDVVLCSSLCKGRYGFTPTFSLAIPANSFRSNYAGTVGSSALNPYVTTLTYTIA